MHRFVYCMPFIVYLEVTGELRRNIETYLGKTRELYGPTEAHQYHPHCSVTGFFDWKYEKEKLIDLFQKLVNIKVNYANKELPKIGNLQYGNMATSMDNLSTNNMDSGNGHNVRISLTAPKWIHDFAADFKAACIDYTNIRVKSIDHISLAYVTSYSAISKLGDTLLVKTRKTTKRNRTVDSKDLQILKKENQQVDSNGPDYPLSIRYNCKSFYEFAKEFINLELSHKWDLVLYEEDDSDMIFLPHKFSELARINL